MTPKEKAKELVQRFSKLEKGLNEEEWKGREVTFEEIHKQSSLICSDEILKFEKNIVKQIKNHIELFKEMKFKTKRYYWQEVKQEINKL